MIHAEEVGKVKGAEPSQASPGTEARPGLRGISTGLQSVKRLAWLNTPGAMPLFSRQEAALGGEVHGWLL
jgi:hypothetical protein